MRTEKTIEKTVHSWGTLRTIEVGHAFKVVIHPEHWTKIGLILDGTMQATRFTDEQGCRWTVFRNFDGSVLFKSQEKIVVIERSEIAQLQ